MVSFLPLHAAINKQLTSDAALKALVYKSAKHRGVYDHVPDDAPKPYVVIGEPYETDFDVKHGQTVDTQITLHAWSAQAGKTEAYKILEAVSHALAASFVVVGYRVDNVKKVTTRVFDDIDGVLRHGVLTLEYTLTKTN